MRTVSIYTRRQGPNRYVGGCVEQDRANNILVNHCAVVSPAPRATKQEALEDAKAYKELLLEKGPRHAS